MDSNKSHSDFYKPLEPDAPQFYYPRNSMNLHIQNVEL